MNTKIKWHQILFVRALVFWVISLILLSCSKTTIPSSGGGGGSSDDPDVGAVDDSAGFYVKPRSVDNVTWDTHKSSAYSTECKAASGEQINCLIEAEELDLFFNGMTLQFNVPSTMCSYVVESPYYYFRYEPGYGPATVYTDNDKNGNVGIDDNDDGVIDRTGNIDANGDGYYELTDSISTCPYDYSASEGPNCCAGTYTLRARVWDSTNNKYTTVLTPNNKWPGAFSNCLAGPAMDTQSKTTSGFPTVSIYNVQGTGINKTYEIKAPISTTHQHLVHIANYFVPNDHQLNSGPKLPLPLYYAKTKLPSRVEVFRLEPYYRYQCLDASHDIVAEILVQIRQWNTKSDFALRTTTGNSETGGCETIGTDSYYKNDYLSWADWLPAGLAGQYYPTFPGAYFMRPCS